MAPLFPSLVICAQRRHDEVTGLLHLPLYVDKTLSSPEAQQQVACVRQTEPMLWPGYSPSAAACSLTVTQPSCAAPKWCNNNPLLVFPPPCQWRSRDSRLFHMRARALRWAVSPSTLRNGSTFSRLAKIILFIFVFVLFFSLRDK
jgi:hypothetical protein